MDDAESAAAERREPVSDERAGRKSRAAGVLVVAAIVAVGLALVLGSGGGHPASAHAASANAKYGGLPSWLPKPKHKVDRVPSASAAHPWLSAIEGETVAVHLAGGSVLATVVGPAVPERIAERAEDGQDDDETAPCTFTATFASASGDVPLRAGDFTILDERGRSHPLRVRMADGGPLPARIVPGHPLTLTMKATLPEGEGALRWAPNGPKVLAGWVYGLELD